MSKRPSFLITLGLAALALPGVAQAGTVTTSGGDLSYVAAPGEANGVYVTREYGTDAITISDYGGTATTSDPSCAERSGNVVCTGITGTIRLDLGDGDDTAGQPSGDVLANPVEIHGGPGNDKLQAPDRGTAASALFGDDGNDTLIGDDQADTLRGGAGDDTLSGNGGADALYGESGNDTLDGDDPNKPAAPDVLDGGDGIDRVAGWTVPQKASNVPISVTLDGAANDGRAGEGDNVTGMERQTSNLSGTFAYGDADDELEIWANVTMGASTVTTAGGNDKVTSGNADETIDTGAGDDRIDAGYGNDVITPGPGRDVVYADKVTPDCGLFESCSLPQGNDRVDVRDGEADTVDCGVGTDTVLADPVDTVSAVTCETIDRQGSAIGPGPAPKGGAKTKAKAKAKVTLSAKRRGSRVVVSGRVAKTLKGAKVTLRLTTAKGKAVSRATTKVGRSGRFTARLRTKGQRGLRLVATVGATKRTAATTKRVSVR